MDRRTSRHAALADRLVAAACAVVGALNVRAGAPGDLGALAGGAASLLGAAGGAALLWRRRRPLTVLAVASAAYAGQVAVAGAVVPVAVWVAVHAIGRYAPRRHAVAGTGGALAALLLVLLADGAADLAAGYLLLALVAGLAGMLGAAAVDRRDGLAREAAAAERLRIARDLHDVVGHGLGAIAVQAGTARVALDAGVTEEARRSLAAIEEASRSSLREVRWVLALLRDDPGRGIRDVPALVQEAREAGLDVALAMTGDVDGAAEPVSAAAFRVVQESLTNALRHAGATHVDVAVAVGGEVLVEVLDGGAEAARVGGPDTTGGDQGLHGGHGLVGMRERVEGTGGVLDTGPAGGGRGWRVVARWDVAGSR
ncbi:MAG TPA: histidine kinase [Jiangellales bacterium]|nr:histidine kinase [Jiangellales bacterium]